MKKLFSACLILLFTACASHRKTDILASKLDCQKDFFFSYDERGDFEDFNYSGKHYGDSPFPEFKETFEKAIAELDISTDFKLSYIESEMLPSDSYVYAHVRIENIRWNFKTNSATLEVHMTYQMGNEKIPIIGTNKVYAMGTKKGNLFKAIKNAHYNFITAFCQ